SEIYYKNLNYIQLNLKTDRYSLVSIKSKNSFSCLDSHPAAQCGLYLSYFFEGDLSLNIPEGDYIINYGEAKNIENSLEISLVESQTVTLSFSPKADKIPVVTPENSKLVVFDDGKNIYSFKNGEQIKVYPNSYNIKVYYDNGVIELKNIEISPNNQTIPIITNQKTAIFSDESGFIFLNSKFYLKIKNSLPIIF
ncbi:hypothetical protein JXR93_06960, partial [bacterium]|nr:hypothetical protein [bacterium]